MIEIIGQTGLTSFGGIASFVGELVCQDDMSQCGQVRLIIPDIKHSLWKTINPAVN